METRAHHVLIGLFTILVALAALVFCLWLTKVGQ
ncbi:MlaD family protein, partial [Escherichia coli]